MLADADPAHAKIYDPIHTCKLLGNGAEVGHGEDTAKELVNSTLNCPKLDLALCNTERPNPLSCATMLNHRGDSKGVDVFTLGPRCSLIGEVPIKT